MRLTQHACDGLTMRWHVKPSHGPSCATWPSEKKTSEHEGWRNAARRKPCGGRTSARNQASRARAIESTGNERSIPLARPRRLRRRPSPRTSRTTFRRRLEPQRSCHAKSNDTFATRKRRRNSSRHRDLHARTPRWCVSWTASPSASRRGRCHEPRERAMCTS